MYFNTFFIYYIYYLPDGVPERILDIFRIPHQQGISEGVKGCRVGCRSKVRSIQYKRPYILYQTTARLHSSDRSIGSKRAVVLIKSYGRFIQQERLKQKSSG